MLANQELVNCLTLAVYPQFRVFSLFSCFSVSHVIHNHSKVVDCGYNSLKTCFGEMTGAFSHQRVRRVHLAQKVQWAHWVRLVALVQLAILDFLGQKYVPGFSFVPVFFNHCATDRSELCLWFLLSSKSNMGQSTTAR